jgi:hypothetical protein
MGRRHGQKDAEGQNVLMADGQVLFDQDVEAEVNWWLDTASYN